MHTAVGNFLTNVKRVAMTFVSDNSTSNVEVLHVSPTYMDIYVHGRNSWVNLYYEVDKGEEHAFITISDSDKGTDHETINVHSTLIDRTIMDKWEGLIASLKEL